MPFILSLLFIFFSTSSFADEPRSALDNTPSVDTAVASSMPTAPASSAPSQDVADEAAPPSPEGQTSYVYDLKKLIIKSRENIKRVNEKIKEQAVMKRNQKREERAREYYQRGIQLTEDGKLDEAREYFEKAVRITEHPEMTYYIQKSEFRLKAQEAALKREERQQLHQQEADDTMRQQDAQQEYEAAVRLYREKKFKEAKDQFEHIEELSPDYKAVRSYLRIVDQDIIEAEAKTQKDQKKEIERQQKEAESAREKEKEVWRKEVERKEEEKRNEVNKQAQDVYEDAVELYKEKKFAEAKKKFEQVEWVIPNYKAARNYLGRIDKDIAIEEKRVNEEKAKALAQQQWEEAVAQRKKEDTEKKAAEEREKQRRKQLEEEAGFVYQAAMTLFNKGLLDDALEKFNDIEKTMPGYKSARVYIAKIAQLKEEEKRREEKMAAEEAKRKALAEEKVRQDAELERQRREQEMARQAQAQAEEKRRRLEQEAEVHYSVAVDLFNQRKYEEAHDEFAKAAAKLPDYKKVQYYLEKSNELDRKLKEEEELEAKRQQIMAEVQAKIAAARAAKAKSEEERVVQQAEAQRLHQEAAQAQERLRQAEAARQERERRQQRQPEAEVPVPPAIVEPATIVEPAPIVEAAPAITETAPVVTPPFIPKTPQQLSREEQIKQAEEIALLAERSSQMYQQIALLANDRRIAPAKKKMAEVDQVLNKLKAQKEKLLQQMREDEERARQRAIKEKQEATRLKAEQTYDEAVISLRSRKFDEARSKFAQIESSAPNYKATRQYLAHIEDDRKKAEAEAAQERTREEAKRLKEMQAKQQAQEKAHRAAEEERQRKFVETQNEQVQSLAQKAYLLNEDILRASKQSDFETAKAKFTELGQVLESLQTVKRSMMDQQQKAALLRKQEEHSAKAEELRRSRAMASLPGPGKGFAPIGIRSALAADPPPLADPSVDVLKQKEVRRYQEEDFRHGVELYNKKRYSPAKIVFEGLAAQGDRRAQAYLKKIDAAMQKQVDAFKKQTTKERSEYIAERRRQEQKALLIQQKEIARQRELTQAMEKQKLAAEEQDQRRRIRQETIQVAQAENKDIDQRRKAIKEEQKPETPGFTKLEPGQTAAAPVPSEGEESMGFSKVEKSGTVISSEQREAQVEFSNQRKKFLEQQYKEQKLKEEQEKKKEQQRLDEDARQRQQRLEAERKAIQQKLGEGVKVMYKDALRLFKQGEYKAAAVKFQDIEDIMPNYKQVRTYLEKAKAKTPPAAKVEVEAEAAPEPANAPPPPPPAPVVSQQEIVPANPPSSRDRDIQKTLDLFDPQ